MKKLLLYFLTISFVFSLELQMPIVFQEKNFGFRYMTYAKQFYGKYDVYHPAADLNAYNDGTGHVEVHAIADGKVVINSNTWLGIVLEHEDENGNKFYSEYGHIGHLDEDLAVGDTVYKNDIIGYIGAVGAAGVYHLHFAIRTQFDNSLADPSEESSWWGINGVEINTRKKVFRRYESPLAFVRTYADTKYYNILVDDSVTYDKIDDDINEENVVVHDNVIVKKRFFKASNLTENNKYSAGTGEDQGFEGNYHYASTSNNSNSNTFGIWYFVIPESGYYDVSVSIPSNHATSEKAEYIINHNGKNDTYEVNQNEVSGDLEDRWVAFGNYYFKKGTKQYIKLKANTGESNREIAFDAVRIEKRKYSDIGNLSEEYKIAIEYLTNKLHMFQGYEDGKFYPNRYINREEVLKTIVILSEETGINFKKAKQSKIDAYPDINLASEWFRSNYALKAVGSNIMVGNKDDGGKLHPKDEVTYWELSKMIVQAFFYNKTVKHSWKSDIKQLWRDDYYNCMDNGGDGYTYKDENNKNHMISSLFEIDGEVMASKGIRINPFDLDDIVKTDGGLKPTRKEVALFLYRAYMLWKNNSKTAECAEDAKGWKL